MDSGSSPITTTTTAAENAAADVLNLIMKPHLELMQTQHPLQQQQQQQQEQRRQQQTQKMRKLVRRNASDKLKLIQMVHDNPILWDSRLPNFKGAEEEKTRAWEHIGKEFNAPGRRVARAFKSLRESYRRELAHVKVMGSGFKPKWSLYEAMDFLRDVIRERKGGSHVVDHSSAATGLNLSALSHHNASLTHHHHHHSSSSNNHSNNNSLAALAHNSLHSSFNDSALNLSSRSSLNLSQDNYNYLVKRELDLSSSAGLAQQLQAANPIAAHNGHNGAHQHHQHPQQHNHHDTRVSSTRNDNTAARSNSNNNNSNNNNNNPNFDDTMDGAGSSSPRSADEEASMRNTGALSCSDEVEELDAIDADFPYPLILDNSTTPPSGGGVAAAASSSGLKRRRKDVSDGADADEDDDDDENDSYGGQMLQQHRHLRQQNGLDMPPPQTVREVLNSKFCGFISAKLNSMEDTEADNLMNKILMLLVQTQGNALLQEANK